MRFFTVLLLFLLSNATNADYQLAKEGAGSFAGWSIAYQSIRYEPLCGNLGTDGYYQNTYQRQPTCTPAMESFRNITDLVAYYDSTGIRQESGGAVLSGDSNGVCMCFALSQIGNEALMGAFCIWVYGFGSTPYYGGEVAADYTPGWGRALPQCGGGFDLQAAKEEWSATAPQGGAATPAASSSSSSPSPLSTTSTSSTTLSNTAVSSTVVLPNTPTTITTVLTVASADGTTKTVTSQIVEQTPVVTVYTGTSGTPVPISDSKGLSNTDKIALGIGLGIGLPLLVLLVVLVMVLARLAQRPRSNNITATYVSGGVGGMEGIGRPTHGLGMPQDYMGTHLVKDDILPVYPRSQTGFD
ncbi:hypothetical protein TWF694_005765 [Orbilia ellipsospora]|uniref:Uncharacterized protein n=1 Tax=Orbilia ellipsospora TaxID=2528407 RepID=A0AAV9WRU8_9PEZI